MPEQQGRAGYGSGSVVAEKAPLVQNDSGPPSQGWIEPALPAVLYSGKGLPWSSAEIEADASWNRQWDVLSDTRVDARGTNWKAEQIL